MNINTKQICRLKQNGTIYIDHEADGVLAMSVCLPDAGGAGVEGDGGVFHSGSKSTNLRDIVHLFVNLK